MAKSKKIIMKSMKDLEFNENIIEDLGLTELEVLNIVSVWYTNGMIPDCIFDENYRELDEVADDLFYDKFEEEERSRLIMQSAYDILAKNEQKGGL
jgi:hypothetical protein